MVETMRIQQINNLELSNKDIKAWGIDPEDLEARLTKLRRMKLTADRQVDSNA